MKKTTVKVRRPFGKNSEKNESQKARWTTDNRVWVYDPVAGHFTTCHSLTANQEAFVRRRCRPV